MFQMPVGVSAWGYARCWNKPVPVELQSVSVEESEEILELVALVSTPIREYHVGGSVFCFGWFDPLLYTSVCICDPSSQIIYLQFSPFKPKTINNLNTFGCAVKVSFYWYMMLCDIFEVIYSVFIAHKSHAHLGKRSRFNFCNPLNFSAFMCLKHLLKKT